MSDIVTLEADDGLDSIRSELVYTKTRLELREPTRALAVPFTALLTRWTLVRDGQLAMWDGEDAADANVAAFDDELDDRVKLIVGDLTHVFGKDHPTFKRYMGGDTKTSIVRLGLGSEIERISSWPDSMRGVPPLASHPDALETLITDGTAALEERVRASSARADHRVREILPFVDDANALRRSTYYTLGTYAVEHSLPSTWPKRFFRTRVHRRRSEA